MLRALLVWLLIIAVETTHGVLRNLLLTPAVGDFRARQVGVFIGSVLILCIAWFTTGWMRITSTSALLLTGLLWTILTLAFEVGLGRALGLSWQRIFSDYDLSHGGLMPIGVLFLFTAPYIAARSRARR